MRRVDLNQEINPDHVAGIKKAAQEAVEACGKDVGETKVECGEDTEGRRWLFIKVEVA